MHWLQALALATIIVSFGPSRRSAAKSTAYETDIVEPLVVSGRLTLKAEVIEETRRSAVKSVGFEMACGRNTASTTAPAASTIPT